MVKMFDKCVQDTRVNISHSNDSFRVVKGPNTMSDAERYKSVLTIQVLDIVKYLCSKWLWSLTKMTLSRMSLFTRQLFRETIPGSLAQHWKWEDCGI